MFHRCCSDGDIHREKSSGDGTTSHPEEVLVTVVLLSLPVGRRAVAAGDNGQSEFAALLSVRLLQEPDEVLVALLLKPSDG